MLCIISMDQQRTVQSLAYKLFTISFETEHLSVYKHSTCKKKLLSNCSDTAKYKHYIIISIKFCIVSSTANCF